MNNRITGLVFLALFVGVAIFFGLRGTDLRPDDQVVPEPTATAAAASEASVAVADSVADTQPNLSANSPPSTKEDAEFQKWVSEEGQLINQRGMDSEQKRRELIAIAKQLTPSKANHLLKVASNAASAAGDKIVAAFLLIEAGNLAQEQLGALIASPLVYGGKQEPHSEGELRGTQERSMRVMAIEGLATRAESDSSARTTLERTIPTIPDPYIRGYAEKRLAQIKGK